MPSSTRPRRRPTIVYGAGHATSLDSAGFAAALDRDLELARLCGDAAGRAAGLAQRLSVAEVLYKDERGRFGLGSFKALGGAYAVANVLRRPG